LEEIRANLTTLPRSCIYQIDQKAQLSTVLPPGYSCSLTTLPFCAPQIMIDFTFRFFVNAKEVLTLPIDCEYKDTAAEKAPAPVLLAEA
jgi:hypothetical protein